MCTVISMDFGKKRLFGRTLDYEYSFREELLLVPRGFSSLAFGAMMKEHLSYIGIGTVAQDVPLMYDGVNEAGLAVAGLSFPYCAVYREDREGMVNIPSYMLTGLLLSECRSLKEARELLSRANITAKPFSESMPPSPLHWIVSDRSGSITVETTDDGVRVYGNPFGVLTNSPDYPYHVTHLSDYMGLSPAPADNRIYPSVSLSRYSRGLGAFGLPGDYSSSSRFVRAVYLKNSSLRLSEDSSEVSEMFHLMDGVSVPKGAVITDKGEGVLTFYTVVYDLGERVCYLSTHSNRRIRSLSFDKRVGEGELVRIPIYSDEDVEYL